MEKGGIDMNIPSCITNAIIKSPLDNDYFYGASEMWERLSDVRNNKVKYLNIDMALLANYIECLYKGFLLSSGVNVSEHVMKESHSLLRLTEEIETKICPLQHNLSRTEERDRRFFLMDLSEKYISCRYYNEQVSFDDFCKCFDWAKIQKDVIHNILNPPQNENIRYYENEERY